MDLLVAAVSLAPRTGGAERTMLEWVAAMQARGHRVRTVQLVGEQRPESGRYWRWRAAQRAQLGELVADALAARRPDVVVTQLHGAPGALEAAVHEDVPGVLVLPSYESLCKLAFDPGSECPAHGDCAVCPAATRLKPLERAALAASRRAHMEALMQAATLVTLSGALASSVRDWTGREATVVWPVPERLPPEAGARWDGPVVCVAARWGVHKGAALLPALVAACRTRALAPLADSSRPASATAREVHVTATGLDRAARIAIRAAGGTVVAAAEIDTLLAGSSLVLVPSQWEEPFGRVAWEALVRGVPVLASDAGGLSEVVRPEGRVAPRETIEAWRAAILRLLGSRARWTAAAASARAEAAALVQPSPVERLERLLLDVAESGPRSRAGRSSVA